MIPAGWKCPRRVGYLFPHPCERDSPAGCPDCDGEQVEDPFGSRRDRYGYTDYDSYTNLRSGMPIGAGRRMDFTEADGENLNDSSDTFEDDMSAS